MKRTFIITEVASYEVKAETAGKALERFTEGDITDFPVSVREREVQAEGPNPVKVGDQVNVDAHGEYTEDFSGIVTTHNDGPNNPLIILVQAPDGEVYKCNPDYVYAPEPSCAFEGAVDQQITCPKCLSASDAHEE